MNVKRTSLLMTGEPMRPLTKLNADLSTTKINILAETGSLSSNYFTQEATCSNFHTSFHIGLLAKKNRILKKFRGMILRYLTARFWNFFRQPDHNSVNFFFVFLLDFPNPLKKKTRTPQLNLGTDYLTILSPDIMEM